MSQPNGKPFFLPPSAAQGLANYPHARTAPSPNESRTLYVSGTSSRRGDGTFAGYSESSDGKPTWDVGQQTRAVLENIRTIIQGATDGKCGLENIIEATIFLIDMKDYHAMNQVWNEFFPSRENAPSRTCVAVHQLPNPKICVEIKSVAVVPIA